MFLQSTSHLEVEWVVGAVALDWSRSLGSTDGPDTDFALLKNSISDLIRGNLNNGREWTRGPVVGIGEMQIWGKAGARTRPRNPESSRDLA